MSRPSAAARCTPTALDLAAELDTLRDVERIDDWDALPGQRRRGLPRCPRCAPEQAAQILYTSGTTGSPKGAVLPHVGMANNAAHAALRITAGRHPPVWLAVLPMFHLASCVVATIGTASLHGTLVTVPQVDAGLGAAARGGGGRDDDQHRPDPAARDARPPVVRAAATARRCTR